MQHSIAQCKGGGQLESVDCNWLDKNRSQFDKKDDEKSHADDELHLQTKQGFDGKSIKSIKPCSSSLEKVYCSSDVKVGLLMPRPPKRTGMPNNSRSTSPTGYSTNLGRKWLQNKVQG